MFSKKFVLIGDKLAMNRTKIESFEKCGNGAMLVRTEGGNEKIVMFSSDEECERTFVKLYDELNGKCNKIKYVRTCYQSVDLGLPSGLLWADRNIGASDPWRYGLYFAWGDTVGYGQDTSDGHLFNWDNCPLGDGSPSMSTLDAEHDAATVNMGVDWRMPDRADYKELLDNCTTKWTTQNGIKGMLFTSKVNGNTLFFPAAGRRRDSSLYDAGSYGYYWSRSLDASYSDDACGLYFDGGGCCTGYGSRYYGRSVRGVHPKNQYFS